MRAIRGAICARSNSRESIYGATQHLLREIVSRNRLGVEDIVAAFFTMTPDLNADFPAYAAREMGWGGVAMLGAQESSVSGAHRRAIRVLVLAEGSGPVHHVYLGRAAAMRPDLVQPGDFEAWDARAGDEEVGGRKVQAERQTDVRLLVVGLGLIGGSVAAGARRSGGFEAIRGYDRSESVMETALARGLVDGVGPLEEELPGADLVVLAAPISEILVLLPSVGRWARAGTVVTDVGSTKRAIVHAMSNLPDRVFGIGGHPMTGRTASGPEAADPDLFRGARWAIVPSRRVPGEAVERVERLVRVLGAHPVRMEAALHDRVVAVTSHLPALVAAVLSEVAGSMREEVRDEAFLAGPGLRSATRLAGGEPAMTAQMLRDNRDLVLAGLERLGRGLESWRAALDGTLAELETRLGEAGATRSKLFDGGVPDDSPNARIGEMRV